MFPPQIASFYDHTFYTRVHCFSACGNSIRFLSMSVASLILRLLCRTLLQPPSNIPFETAVEALSRRVVTSEPGTRPVYHRCRSRSKGGAHKKETAMRSYLRESKIFRRSERNRASEHTETETGLEMERENKRNLWLIKMNVSGRPL